MGRFVCGSGGGNADVRSMAASSPPDGLSCCRRRRPVRQPVGEICLPQLDAFGLVVLHPVLGFCFFRVGGLRSQDGGALLLLHRCGRRRWSFIELRCVDPSFGALSLAALPWVGASSSVGKESSLAFFCALCFRPPRRRRKIGAAGDEAEKKNRGFPLWTWL